MTEHDVQKSEMEAIRRLSQIGGLIAEAEGHLHKVKTTTDQYVREREELTEKAIAGLMARSQDMLQGITVYHEKVISFADTVHDLGTNLSNAYDFIEKMGKKFLEYAEKSEKDIKYQHEIIDERIRVLKIREMRVEGEAGANRQRTTSLNALQARLQSKEESIMGALKVLANKQKNA